MLQVFAFGWELGCRLGTVLFGLRWRVRGAQSAGMCARRRRSFSLLCQRKGPKRKAALLPATPTLRIGATAVLDPGAAPRNSLRGMPLRSNSRGGSVDGAGVSCGTPTRPRVCAPWRRQKGGEREPGSWGVVHCGIDSC